MVFLALFIALKLYQFWLHTQTIDRIPLIEGIFSTPSSHRVHHAKNAIYIDRNYGGTLVIWDKLFKSWQPELTEQPCHYGTTHPLATLNPIHGNLQHWSMLAKDTVQTKYWSDKVRLWFKPTGWRPTDCRDSKKDQFVLQKTGCENREKYDPQISMASKFYVGFSFLSIIAVTVMFIFLSPVLSGKTLVLGTMLIVFSLVVINELLEGNNKHILLEIVRLPAVFWFTSTLWFTTSTTQLSNNIIMAKPPAEVLAYASTPALWSDWHPKSSVIKVESQLPLKQDDTFAEEVLTITGKNQLTWQVIDSIPSEIWIAKAENKNNGVTLLLTYTVENIDGNTKFIRELNYTMPNFLFLVANEIFFKKELESKSITALQRLKVAVENRDHN
jgi:hypothetical protein